MLSLVGIVVTTVKLKRIKKEEAENPIMSEDVYYKESGGNAN